MSLTDREKEQIKAMIDRGEKLPPKYRLMLFEDAPEVELIWQGKTSEVTNVVLPFQSIEQIDEPRADAGKDAYSLFSVDKGSGRQAGGWTNKLIWGDNKLVLSSLNNGPIRRDIEEAGGIRLVYIDPPFDVGADFSVDVEVGDDSIVKEPSLIEEIAYRDTWGRGLESYIAMIYERIKLIHSLLSSDASVYIHCDWRVNSLIRIIMDEIFGENNYINEIIWRRTGTHGTSRSYGVIHDTILFYSKSQDYIFKCPSTDLDQEYLDSHYTQKEKDGRRYQLISAHGAGQGPSRKFGDRELPPPTGRHWAYSQDGIDKLMSEGKIVFTSTGMPRIKRYADESKKPVPSIWADISVINSQAEERLNYSTQKPEELLARIIEASSEQGQLVADLFCGSGTTLAAAERLGRKWIGCDLGRFAVHTTQIGRAHV